MNNSANDHSALISPNIKGAGSNKGTRRVLGHLKCFTGLRDAAAGRNAVAPRLTQQVLQPLWECSPYSCSGTWADVKLGDDIKLNNLGCNISLLRFISQLSWSQTSALMTRAPNRCSRWSLSLGLMFFCSYSSWIWFHCGALRSAGSIGGSQRGSILTVAIRGQFIQQMLIYQPAAPGNQTPVGLVKDTHDSLLRDFM